MNTNNTLEVCSNLDNILEQYGNINFISKEELYLLIDYIRDSFEIYLDGDAFNIIKFYKNNFSGILDYQLHSFNDKTIGGFLVKNKYPEKSHIVINSSKDGLSSLFDLGHELIHFLLHPEDRNHYISTSLCNIDNFEWQANEGAAELLVPYRKFIPKFARNIKKCKNYNDYITLVKKLSDDFVVSTAVIEYRIKGLKYEIYQYENGTIIDNLKFLSQRAQEENGINITPYNIIFKNKKNSLKDILADFTINDIPKHIIKQADDLFGGDNEKQNQPIENWEDILDYFKSNGKIVLYTNLVNTELLPINDNTVGINFIKGLTPFGKTVLEKENNFRLIEQQVSLLFNKKMNINFINKSSENVNIKIHSSEDDLPF